MDNPDEIPFQEFCSETEHDQASKAGEAYFESQGQGEGQPNEVSPGDSILSAEGHHTTTVLAGQPSEDGSSPGDRAAASKGDSSGGEAESRSSGEELGQEDYFRGREF